MVSLNIEGKDPSEVGYELDESYGIMTRAGLHCAPLAHRTIGTHPIGTVRFSFGYYNTEKEVEKAVKALKEMASEGQNENRRGHERRSGFLHGVGTFEGAGA